MVMSLEIAAIKAKLFYRRSSFNIDLSYSLFNGNTEGLCGELLDNLIPDS